MRRVISFAVLSTLAASPAMAGGEGGATNAPRPTSGASRLSPDVGAGQSPSQAAHDQSPRHTRASLAAQPTKNPNRPGNAASDGTAGTSSPRAPEPKPGS